MYLDPGFGSMVIQLFIAGVAAAGSYLFLFRQKIKAFFGRSRAKKSEGETEDTGV
jgi:hypothetical protein